MSRIVNKEHFERITSILKATKGTVSGGTSDPSTLFIEPTFVSNLSQDDSLFQSELFGPILPILTHQTLPESRDIITAIDETPLALYIMTEDPAEAAYIRDNTSSGGMSINDIMGQSAAIGMPFGGFGQSGMGSFHGRAGIDTFSHRKSVVTVPTDPGFEAMMEWRYVTGDLE